MHLPFKVASLPMRLHRHIRFQLHALPHIPLPFPWKAYQKAKAQTQFVLTVHTINLSAHVKTHISDLSLDYATPLDIGIDSNI